MLTGLTLAPPSLAQGLYAEVGLGIPSLFHHSLSAARWAPAQVVVLTTASQPLHLLLRLCRAMPACWDGCGPFLINAQQVLLEEPTAK